MSRLGFVRESFGDDDVGRGVYGGEGRRFMFERAPTAQ